MAKKYYWIKLKNDFFSSKEIKKLRRTAGGDTFVIIYLKMQLFSLQNEGKIYYDGIEEDFASEIALTLDEDPDNVRLTMAFLQNCGLIECNEVNECFLTKVPEITGKECDSAERVRKHRALQCNNNVTSSNNEVTKCNTEIEKELELEKEKDISLSDKSDGVSLSEPPKKKKSKVPKHPEAYEKIIYHLNCKANTLYRPSGTLNQKYIDARLNEGFTVENFITVIDKKCAEWLGTDMEKYLRPETLFGNKFESYLNQVIQPRKQTGQNGIEIEHSSGNGEWDSIFEEL